jgi:pSer/pThr/pTyr-binding forkhead associated (FHA) protein
MLDQDDLTHGLSLIALPEAVPMDVRLVIERGAKRKVLHFRGDEAVVGRSHGNTVRIPSAEVSRQHCRLYLNEGLVTVEDLGSVNGTFLNGQRIQEGEVVRPGDNIEVGPVRFVVEYELTPEALDRLREIDGQVQQVEALEGLIDGEVIPDEELPVLQELEEESLPVVEQVEVKGEVEVTPMEAEELGALPVDFDFDATSWQMPEGGDLRDLLSEDGDEPPTKHRKPRR